VAPVCLDYLRLFISVALWLSSGCPLSARGATLSPTLYSNAIVVWALAGWVLGLEAAGPLQSVLCVECVVAWSVNVLLVLKLRAWERS
jgi:hypothetical protein